LMSLLNRNLL